MKKKKITVNINSTYKYLQLWNGIFKLTDKELTILSAFIDVNIATKDANICSVKNKKEVAKIIGIKDYNTLNNYVKSFKDKGVVIKKSSYTLNPFLHPDTDAVEIKINKV
tara:strand:- start:247 stop:576 length:330 start_codon:yes stop_codon:yes gene_type:complete